MKLKTRIIVGFGMSILVPLLLFSATLYGLGHTKFAQQTKDSSEVVYDISVGESTHSQTQVRIICKRSAVYCDGNISIHSFIYWIMDLQKYCHTAG